MTITHIELRNFGVYADSQTIDLTSAHPDRPIVLVGGENGRGKTTLLEALFLVLYGKLAPAARSARAYAKYLASRVNTSSDSYSATVSVGMHLPIDGVPAEVEVIRSWTSDAEKPNERLIVRRDGWTDQWLTDNWNVYWPQILPVDIAELFFFDGERIESLADGKTSARVIKNSLYALFGISPIVRLRNDLEIVEKKVLSQTEDDRSDELSQTYRDYRLLKASYDTTETDIDAAVVLRADIEARIDRLREDLAQYGGSDVLGEREKLRDQAQQLDRELVEVERDLRVLAAGDAPFLAIQEAAIAAHEWFANRREHDENARERKILEDHQAALIEFVKKEIEVPVAGDVSKAIERYFETLSVGAGEDADPEFVPQSLLNLVPVWRAFDESLQQSSVSVAEAVKKFDELVIARQSVEDILSALPAEESVSSLLASEDQLHNALKECDAKLHELREKLAANEIKLDEAHRRYQRIAEAELRNRHEAREEARIVAHAERTATVLDKLEHRLIRKHISRLEIELTEKLALLHSKRLVNHVRILPETFEVELTSEDGRIVGASSLSAGERQLLALAILWSIQSFSDRKMPMVVDTPLGRLDNRHRKNMVERFLTEATHQAIVLSTDSEVTPELLKHVEDRVTATFRLVYDESRSSTRIEPGYFEEEAKSGHAEKQLA